MAGIDAFTQHAVIGLVFMDGLELLLQEPRSGIEPLQEDADFCHEQVP